MRTYIFYLILFVAATMQAQNYRPSPGIETRVNALLGKMTVDEKIGQLTLYTTDWGSTGPTIREGYKNDIRSGACGNLFNSHTTAFVRDLQKVAVEETRLKIPLLFGFDVIHGYKTIFPIPLGEAASWDLEAIEKSARVAATEASAAGLNWTYAPMVDITRDPRWGRVMEGAGEDTWLGCRIAEARTHGIQGKKLGSTDAMLACVKHYAAYGAPIAGRDYNTVDMSERYLREYYLPPYEAAVRAGAATVMTSFNDYDGVPASGNKFLLDNVLRKEWGFKGFVVTDYTSMNEMVNHGVVSDDKEAGELALQAGVDMDMQGAIYQRFLKQSLREGKVTQKQIDEAVRRVLRLKFELGLFEDPYKFCDAAREKSTLLSAAHRAAARDVARKSIVLLKNDRQVLPLKHSQKIALIGPLANNKSELLGNWNGAGNADDCVSLLEALDIPVIETESSRAEDGKITFAPGCDIEGSDQSGFAKALQVAQSADVIVVAVGEKAMMSGEAAARSDIGLPGIQEELVLALVKTGKPVVVVLMNGRPLAIPKIAESATAILETWWLGTEAGNAIADVLFGDYNPSGKLPMTFPRSVGQVPVFYNYKSTGRPFDPNSKWTSKYIDLPNSPQWPFGFGLSYTTFGYSEPTVEKMPKSGNDPKASLSSSASLPICMVKATVTNTGKVAGEEVVQLYVRDLVGSVTRPVKELKGFQKILLQPGESKEVTFTLTARDLGFYRKNNTFGMEPGEFEMMVGGDSEGVKRVKVRL